MSEFSQSRRLQDAELPVSPELWARLEGRLAGKAEQAPRRFRIGYWAVAASLVLAFWGGMYWQSLRQEAAPSVVFVDKPASFSSSSQAKASLVPVQATASITPVAEPEPCILELAESTPPFLAAKPAYLAKRQTRRCTSEQVTASSQATITESSESVSSSVSNPSERAQASLDMTVAQFNAPNLVLPPADSLRVISPAIGSQDSLAILLAVTTQRPGRDSLRSAKAKPQQKQTIINKINRALRWLPGGSAWPTIRFEKAEVAVAFHDEPHQGVAP